jgi:putative heme-binding domain-containing protein
VDVVLLTRALPPDSTHVTSWRVGARRSSLDWRQTMLWRGGAVAVGAVVTLAVVCGRSTAAQHGYTKEQIDNGGRLYQASCATCHGPRGDTVRGVNLFSGRYNRATSDEQLVRIVVTGIPGTAMPPNNYTDTDAGMIVAYLRAAGAAGGMAPTGDAARGKAAFDGKGKCQGCHGPDGVGTRTAPSLADVGAIRTPPELARALLDPSAEIHPDFRTILAVTKAGVTITGRLMNQDSFTIQLLDSTGQLRGLQKADLKEYTMVRNSPMPSSRGVLTPQEIDDVVAYLAGLRGQP